MPPRAAANATAGVESASGQSAPSAVNTKFSARGTIIASTVSLVVAAVATCFLIAGLLSTTVTFTACFYTETGEWTCAGMKPTFADLIKDGACSQAKHMGQSAMAFGILSVLFCAASKVVSVVALCIRNRKLPVASCALLAAATVCAMITMGIDIGFYTHGVCGIGIQSANEDGVMGASPFPDVVCGTIVLFVFVVLFVGTFASLATHVVLQRRAENAHAEVPLSSAGSYGTVDAPQTSVNAGPGPSCACDLFMRTSVATFVVAALAISLLIAGVAAPVMSAKACDRWGYCLEVEVTLIEIYSKGCTKAVNMANTVMASAIIGAIVCAASMVVTVVATCKRNRKLLVVSGFLLVAAAGCAMLAMAVDISFFTQSICNGWSFLRFSKGGHNKADRQLTDDLLRFQFDVGPPKDVQFNK